MQIPNPDESKEKPDEHVWQEVVLPFLQESQLGALQFLATQDPDYSLKPNLQVEQVPPLQKIQLEISVHNEHFPELRYDPGRHFVHKTLLELSKVQDWQLVI